MGESALVKDVEAEVLGEGEEFPKRGQCAAFRKGRYGEIKDEHCQVGRDDTEETFEIEFSIGNWSPLCHPAEELSADQVAAEDEEQVDACPSETTDGVHPRRMTEHMIMIDEYDNDRQGTEMIEACETFGGRKGLHRNETDKR